MFIDICNQFNVAPKTVIAVGDSERDIQAALAAGCRPVLVLTGNGKKAFKKGDLPENVRVFEDLLTFSEYLVDLCD